MLSWSLMPQTTVSRKRLEKFLGSNDLEADTVRHDSSFSKFIATVEHFTLLLYCSVATLSACFNGSICFSLSDSAVTVSDGSFAWEKHAEPFLKKYDYSVTAKNIQNYPEMYLSIRTFSYLFIYLFIWATLSGQIHSELPLQVALS